jgi:CheY-like chemotaxis protein
VNDERRALLAHDLKTPLAAIIGYAELLRTRDDDEIRREAPVQIAEAARRLSAAIDHLVGSLDAESIPELKPPPPLRTRPLPAGARKQIVVVDDDALVRSLLRATLSPDEFDVAEAADGRTALKLTEATMASLVLLDWHMPGRSGADVLAELKTRFPALPVLVITADKDPRLRKLAERLGADAFLRKPFSPLQLLEVVERLLSERLLDQGA